MKLMSILAGILAPTVLITTTAQAKIIKSGPDHFTLQHEAISELPPEKVWKKLIKPSNWWHPDHTYSGSAKNLSFKARAGGHWKEVWPEGSVIHGTVLYIKKGETLRMNAPFGPLQEMAVTDIWTISLSPHDGGTKIVFDEIVNGHAQNNLEELAPAVDFVKQEAIQRLAATSIPN